MKHHHWGWGQKRLLHSVRQKSVSYSKQNYAVHTTTKDSVHAASKRDNTSAFDGMFGTGMGMDRYSSMPIRPSIPPIAFAALGLWLACAAALFCAPNLSSHTDMLASLCALILALILSAIAFITKRHKGTLLACAIGVSLGVALGFSTGVYVQTSASSAVARGYTDYKIVAMADASHTSYGQSCLVNAVAPDGTVYKLRAYLDVDTDVRYGDTVQVRATIKAPSEQTRTNLLAQGIVGSIDVTGISFSRPEMASRPLVSIRNAAIDIILEGPGSYEARSAVAALACGYRGALDQTNVYDAFKTSGLAHVIAVSGSHLSLIAGLAACALRTLPLGVRSVVTVNGALIMAYLVVSGMPISAVRAALMTICGLASVFAGRRGASANALGICIIALIVVDPSCAVSVSFALSASSTASIVLFAPLMRAWATALVPHLPASARDAATLTGAASIGSTPLSAAVFAQIPLVSLPANIVAGPLFSGACALGLLGSLISLVIPEAAYIMLIPALPFAEALIFTARFFASLPFACIPASVSTELAVVVTVGIAALLWKVWPLFSRRALFALSGACVGVALIVIGLLSLFAADEIVALDVGQGDAILVRSAGAAVLVDTGTNDTDVLAALARHGIVQLDAVIITHGDDDHCGSLNALGNAVEIKRVLLAQNALSCTCDSCSNLRAVAQEVAPVVEGLSVGDCLQVGRFSLAVIWPDSFVDEGGNADSLCLLVSYERKSRGSDDGKDTWTALLVGDAEGEQLEALLASNRIDDIDVYKVGHHGSRAAIDAEIAEMLAPRIALISVGAYNRYGHPATETLEALEGVGCAIFRTDEAGDVTCRFFSDRIEVVSMR